MLIDKLLEVFPDCRRSDLSGMLSSGRFCVDAVCENGYILATLIYRFDHDSIRLISLASCGELTKILLGKLIALDLPIRAVLDEADLPNQMALRESGFRATGLIKNFFSDRDAIVFEFHPDIDSRPPATLSPNFVAFGAGTAPGGL